MKTITKKKAAQKLEEWKSVLKLTRWELDIWLKHRERVTEIDCIRFLQAKFSTVNVLWLQKEVDLFWREHMSKPTEEGEELPTWFPLLQAGGDIEYIRSSSATDSELMRGADGFQHLADKCFREKELMNQFQEIVGDSWKRFGTLGKALEHLDPEKRKQAEQLLSRLPDTFMVDGEQYMRFAG